MAQIGNKRIKGEFIHALPVCACMCVNMFGCTCVQVKVHMCMFMWRPEVAMWHLSQSFSSLFTKAGTFAEPRAHRLDEVS